MSSPGVRRPTRRAVAMVAIGVIERALATAPIRAEDNRLGMLIWLNLYAVKFAEPPWGLRLACRFAG